MQKDDRSHRGGVAPIGGILEQVVRALVPPTHIIPAASLEARARRTVRRELERQIGRAVWRAERRSRRVPRHVRQSASWVNGQRRRLAYEISRALVSLGAGRELARALSERACQRFPRDGIVIPDDQARPERPAAGAPRRPRLEGTAPRQRGVNPRATGHNPRARGSSPRQRREQLEQLERRRPLAPADLSDQLSVAGEVAALNTN